MSKESGGGEEQKLQEEASYDSSEDEESSFEGPEQDWDGQPPPLHEVLRESDEWRRMEEFLALPKEHALVGVTRVEAFGYDEYLWKKKAAELGGASRLLVYQPEDEQYHAVLSHGFPTTHRVQLARRLSPSGATCGLVCEVALSEAEAQEDAPELLLQEPARAVPRFIVRVDRAPYDVTGLPQFPARGDFNSPPVRVKAGASIADALRDLPPMSTLLLEAGKYTEQLLLENVSVRITSDGGAIIRSPTKLDGATQTATIRVKGTGVVELDNLTVYGNRYRLRPAAQQPFVPESPGPEVGDVVKAAKEFREALQVKATRKHDLPVVDQGHAGCGIDAVQASNLNVLNCYVVGGIEVSKGSHVGVRSSSFVDGIINGAYVRHSQFVAEESTFSSHDSSNIAAEGCAPLFRRCVVSHGLSTGVYVFNGARVIMIECDVHSNEHTGIQVEGAGTTVDLLRCRVHHGDQYGIFMTDKASGTVYNCHFYANGWAAATCTEGADALFRHNTAFSGLNYGFYTFDSGKGRWRSNWLHSNKDAAFSVASEATPVIELNHVFDNHSYGFYFFLGGHGTVRRNQIYCNRHSNICITYASNPTVSENHIYDCHTDGVYIMQEGQGLFEANEIFRNMESNVMVQFDAEPVFRKNKIHHALKTGVCIFHEGKGTFEDNEVCQNTYSAFAIKTRGNPVIRNNLLAENGRFGILGQFNGKGLVEKCTFRSNKMGTVRVWKDTTVELKDNIFEEAPPVPTEQPPERPAPAPPTEEQTVEGRVDLEKLVNE